MVPVTTEEPVLRPQVQPFLCGGWVLDLSALQGIQIDPLARMATVGAGVVTADLQATVENRAFYPPDPSSKKYSTLVEISPQCRRHALRGGMG